MEQEIDLGPYIKAIFRRWWWPILGAVLTAVVAYIGTLFMTPKYQATALVVITQATETVQFDPRFEPVNQLSPPYRAFLELAMSDEVVQMVLEDLGGSFAGIDRINQLRKVLEVESGEDIRLLRLSAEAESASDAVLLANTWSTIFLDQAEAVFGNRRIGQVLFFEDQLAQAEAHLADLEQALIAFQDKNRIVSIHNELTTIQEAQVEYLREQQRTPLLLQYIEELRIQLESNNLRGVTVAEQLAVVSLQLEVFNAAQAVPIQLQLESLGIDLNSDRGEQLSLLDGLIETLENRLSRIEDSITALEPQILTRQRLVQELQAEQDRLLEDVELAQETYKALTRKVEEERITSQGLQQTVRLAANAIDSGVRSSPNAKVIVASGSVIGFLLGLIIILVHEFRARAKDW